MAIYSRVGAIAELSRSGEMRAMAPATYAALAWLLAARGLERAGTLNAGGDDSGRKTTAGLTVTTRASQCGDGVAADEGFSGGQQLRWSTESTIPAAIRPAEGSGSTTGTY